MVGAIIGDLAAWTWEHDKNAFLKKPQIRNLFGFVGFCL